uniref:LAGLIDADG homing endonuclease n=1 Tax=Knipowitschia caucasica TaxID=637954 RepID=A0AAV2K142_KNICA
MGTAAITWGRHNKKDGTFHFPVTMTSEEALDTTLDECIAGVVETTGGEIALQTKETSQSFLAYLFTVEMNNCRLQVKHEKPLLHIHIRIRSSSGVISGHFQILTPQWYPICNLAAKR